MKIGHTVGAELEDHRFTPKRTNVRAIQFDGVNDYIGGFPYMYGVFLDQDFTIEFWLKDFGLRAAPVRELLMHSSNNYLEINLNTRIRWQARYANATVKLLDYIFPVPLVKTNWTHFAFRYKATTRVREIFINGVSVATDTLASPFSLAGSNVAIGATQTGTLFYQGKMDEFRAYQRWLPDAEITHSFNGGAGNFPSNESSLMYWFAFENYLENWGSAPSYSLHPLNNFTGNPFIPR